ncbi:MAG: hypothetical protein AVDCRST_MAG17-990, partial [uncultured Solirubrobacterales bacterium]
PTARPPPAHGRALRRLRDARRARCALPRRDVGPRQRGRGGHRAPRRRSARRPARDLSRRLQRRASVDHGLGRARLALAHGARRARRGLRGPSPRPRPGGGRAGLRRALGRQVRRARVGVGSRGTAPFGRRVLPTLRAQRGVRSLRPLGAHRRRPRRPARGRRAAVVGPPAHGLAAESGGM